MIGTLSFYECRLSDGTLQDGAGTQTLPAVIHLSFLHSRVVGMLKYCSHTYLRPRAIFRNFAFNYELLIGCVMLLQLLLIMLLLLLLLVT